MNVFDLGGSVRSGLQTGMGVMQARRQNALADVYRKQGAGILAGDQGALDALAAQDPVQALQVQNSLASNRRAEAQFGMDQEQRGMNMDLTRERITEIRRQAAEAAKAEAARMDAAALERERQQLSGVVSGARQAIIQGPEAWEQFKSTIPADVWQQSGLDPASLTFETAPAALAMVVGMLEGVEEARQFTDGMNGGGADTEAEREIQRLQSIGYTREQAIGLKEGVLSVFTDPVTRETTLINKITGEIVQPVKPQGQTVQPDNAQQPAQPMTAPQQEPLSFGADVPSGGEQAFGALGMGARAANAVSDFVGMGEVFPNAAEQTRFFKLLEEDLLVTLSQAYGRQPAQQLMERIRKLLPQAGAIEGAATARGELAQLRRRFERDLGSLEQSLKRRMAPDDRTATQNQINGLRATLATIDEAEKRLGGSDAPSADDDALIQKWLGGQ